MTNYQAELADYFTIGSDLECYTCEEELLEKCKYYLKHEDERSKIANHGYETIKQYYNYPERLLQMLSLAYELKEEKL